MLAEQNHASIEANRRRIFEVLKALKSDDYKFKIGVHLVGECKEKETTSHCVEGQKGVFEIENLSTESVFVQVLDLATSGRISSVIRSVSVGPGQKIRSPFLIFGAPYGSELFKVFASREPVDMSFLEYSAEAINASSPLRFNMQPNTTNPLETSGSALPNAWPVLDYIVVIERATIIR